MSSRRKDARWARALWHVETIGLEWGDVTYDGQVKLLDLAEDYLGPQDSNVELHWYQIWRERNGELD